MGGEGGDIVYLEGRRQTPAGELNFVPMHVADLVLTTGRVVVRDALMPDDRPLKRTVRPGTYPFIINTVILPGEDGPRPVAAMVQFSPERADRWTHAVRRHRLSWLHPSFRNHQVAIDSWHLGILDVDAAAAWDRYVQAVSPDDGMKKEHAANGGVWNVYRFDGTSANMVTCFSGMGSGGYPVYWGFAGDGEEPVCLAVDFSVFEYLRHIGQIEPG